jgi:hypothetical protein
MYVYTTGKPVFVVRQNLCRAFYFGRTAKKNHGPNKLFVVRLKKMHGKELVCRAFFIAHGKVFFSPYAFRITQMKLFLKYFAVRILFDARQTHVFAVRFCYSARQSIFYLFSLGPKSNYS